MKLRPEKLEPLSDGVKLVPHSRKILAAIWREPRSIGTGQAGGDEEVLRR